MSSTARYHSQKFDLPLCDWDETEWPRSVSQRRPPLNPVPSAAAVCVGPKLHQKMKKRKEKKKSGLYAGQAALKGREKGWREVRWRANQPSEWIWWSKKQETIEAAARSGFTLQCVSAEIRSVQVELNVKGVDTEGDEHRYPINTCRTRSIPSSQFLAETLNFKQLFLFSLNNWIEI